MCTNVHGNEHRSPRAEMRAGAVESCKSHTTYVQPFGESAAQTQDDLPPNPALKTWNADDRKEPIRTKQVKSYIASHFLLTGSGEAAG